MQSDVVRQRAAQPRGADSTALFVDTNPRPAYKPRSSSPQTPSRKQKRRHQARTTLLCGLGSGLALALGAWLTLSSAFSHVHEENIREYRGYLQEWEREHRGVFEATSFDLLVNGSHTFHLNASTRPTKSVRDPSDPQGTNRSRHVSHSAAALLTQLYPPGSSSVRPASMDRLLGMHFSHKRRAQATERGENKEDAQKGRPVADGMQYPVRLSLRLKSPDYERAQVLELGEFPMVRVRLLEGVDGLSCQQRLQGVFLPAEQRCVEATFLRHLCVKLARDPQSLEYSLDPSNGGVGCQPVSGGREWQPAEWRRVSVNRMHQDDLLWLPRSARDALTVVVRHARDPELLERELTARMRQTTEPLMVWQAIGMALAFLGLVGCIVTAVYGGPLLREHMRLYYTEMRRPGTAGSASSKASDDEEEVE